MAKLLGPDKSGDAAAIVRVFWAVSALASALEPSKDFCQQWRTSAATSSGGDVVPLGKGDPVWQQDDIISLTMPDFQRLYAAPGTVGHVVNITVALSSQVGTATSVLVSFREDFPISAPASAVAAGQTVKSLVPQGLVSLEPGEAINCTLYLEPPSFLPDPSRPKITLSVQTRIASRGSPSTGKQMTLVSVSKSFYFTVTSRDLASLDSDPPDCQSVTICDDLRRNCASGGTPGLRGPSDETLDDFKCNDTRWHSQLVVKDGQSGLWGVAVTSPGSRLLPLKGFSEFAAHSDVIGSLAPRVIFVETQCCYGGVELSATDVAGNARLCVVGSNPNKAGGGPVQHRSVHLRFLFLVPVFFILFRSHEW